MSYVMDGNKIFDAIRKSLLQLSAQKSNSTIFKLWCPQQNARLARMKQNMLLIDTQVLDDLTVISMLKSIMVDTPNSEFAMRLHAFLAQETIFSKDLVSFKTGDEVERLASSAQSRYRVNQSLDYDARQKDLPKFYPDAFKKVYGQICRSIIEEETELNQSNKPTQDAERRAKEYLGYDLPPLEARNRRASMGVSRSRR